MTAAPSEGPDVKPGAAPTPDIDPPENTDDVAGPRIDKWLWYARFFKTRTLASKICNGGKMRVNSAPISKAHYKVRRGDVLTFPQGGHIRVIEIVDFGARRGPAPEARTLYTDLAPPQPKSKPDPSEPPRHAGVPERAAGAGRPTKADRRALDRLRGRDDG